MRVACSPVSINGWTLSGVLARQWVGGVRAVRAWHDEALERLTQLGFDALLRFR